MTLLEIILLSVSILTFFVVFGLYVAFGDADKKTKKEILIYFNICVVAAIGCAAITLVISMAEIPEVVKQHILNK